MNARGTGGGREHAFIVPGFRPGGVAGRTLDGSWSVLGGSVGVALGDSPDGPQTGFPRTPPGVLQKNLESLRWMMIVPPLQIFDPKGFVGRIRALKPKGVPDLEPRNAPETKKTTVKEQKKCRSNSQN